MTDTNKFVLQSCTVQLTTEDGYCSDSSVQCCDDSNAVISIKIEPEEPIAISFSSIKDEPEVSLDISAIYSIAVSNYAFPNTSAQYGKW
jgi:hypothetical protein